MKALKYKSGEYNQGAQQLKHFKFPDFSLTFP
jgi:hypothetical protein